jgi:Regulator of chromosome condensation (RCC1) repeat
VIACRWCLFLVLAAACGGSDATSVRVRVQYEPGWGLDGLRIEAGGRGEDASLDDTVTLLVPDAWAGEAVAIQVSGMSSGQVSARGEGEAIPRRGAQVEIAVAMALVPCDEDCPDCPSCELCGGSCESPPAPECVDDATLRVHESAGTCDGESCQYAHSDMPCAHGCSQGACKSIFDAGGRHTCAVDDGGAAVCWGRNEYGEVSVPEGSFAAISAGARSTCALRRDGTVACWGDDADGQSTPPADVFTAVSTGSSHACGLKPDATPACWGLEGARTTPPAGTFSAVSCGAVHSCGLKTDGTLACWGDNLDGKSEPPAGMFSAVSAGGQHACALGSEGTISCWGQNEDGQTTAPEGTFSSISAGGYHNCAIRTDGRVACWGLNDLGQIDAPDGIFTAVSAGAYHSCAVDFDGVMVCWGDDTNGQSMPPRF